MAQYRRPSRKLTFDDAVEIWLIWLTTREIQSRIASKFDTNQGRVCEVLAETRHPGARKVALVRLRGANDNGGDDSGPDQPKLI
jgi:hypothetical protein